MDFNHQTSIPNITRWDSPTPRPVTSLKIRHVAKTPPRNNYRPGMRTKYRLDRQSVDDPAYPTLQLPPAKIKSPPAVTVQTIEKQQRRIHLSDYTPKVTLRVKTISSSPAPRQPRSPTSGFEEFLAKSKIPYGKPLRRLKEIFNKKRASLYEFDKEINGVSVIYSTITF